MHLQHNKLVVTLACLLAAILVPTAALADVTGKVTHKGDPRAGCGISLGAVTGTTAPDGGFTVRAGNPGRLRVDCAGFAPKFVSVQNPGATLGEIELKRPNFILIVSDDQGWVQTSTQMDPDDPETRSDYFRTPHMDSLFEAGIRFTRGYSPGTYCMPTRRSIQVSHSPLRHAFNGAPVDDWTVAYKELPTIPKVLKSADPDYMAAHLGKWDLRYDDPDPALLGYDVSDGATGNGEGNVGARTRKNDRGRASMDKSALNPSDDPKSIFDLTRRATDFMQRQVNDDKPFFIQLSHYAVHLAVFFKPETYNEVLGWQKGKKHFIPSFAAMLKDLDDGIGDLMKNVDALGIADNTYIIFMADNGGRPTQNLEDGRVRERVNHPLSVGKHSIYEGGIRVPFVVVGPGIEAGSFVTTAVSGVDILPTIADIVDSKVELGDIDGGSFKDLIYRESDAVVRPRPYLVFHDKSATVKTTGAEGDSESALMQGDFKLIKTWKGGRQNSVELYDLARDKEESHDLVEAMPGKASEMGKLLDDYIAEVGGDVTITTD
jgi:arylsulfatase A-like enzyme